jgi:hypothetical protein
MVSYTATQKLEAIRREIKFRRRVYGRRVALHQMTQALADYELDIMEAIAADYEKQAEGERFL